MNSLLPDNTLYTYKTSRRENTPSLFISPCMQFVVGTNPIHILLTYIGSNMVKLVSLLKSPESSAAVHSDHNAGTDGGAEGERDAHRLEHEPGSTREGRSAVAMVWGTLAIGPCRHGFQLHKRAHW